MLLLKLLFPLNYDSLDADYHHIDAWCVRWHQVFVTWFPCWRLWIVGAIKNVSYYVKYFDMDSFSLNIFRECHLIPNLGGNRLTNDGKMAMNEGESDVRRRRWGKKEDFFYWCACLLILKTTMMMNLNTTAKNHSKVSCSASSSYRSGIIKMTLFAVVAFGFKQFINVHPELS